METRQKKIIVPIDGSPASHKAIKVGEKFAESHGSELVLLYIVEPVPNLVEFFAERELTEKQRNWGLRMLENTKKGLGETKVPVSSMIMTGKPYRKILDASEEIQAEMIVMGAKGSHTENETVIGSNLQKVYRNANVPVVSVPSSIEEDQFKKVLITVDPDFGVVELERFLYQYKDTYQPEVEMITVVNDKEKMKEAQEFLDKNQGALTKAGIPGVKTNVVVGSDPAYCILRYAEENEHDIIWMETHGRTGLAGWLFGSVTGEVLNAAPVPVLTLHPEREPVKNYYYHRNLPI